MIIIILPRCAHVWNLNPLDVETEKLKEWEYQMTFVDGKKDNEDYITPFLCLVLNSQP